MMLRQEVYADDAPPGSSEEMIRRAKTPYTVVEQDFTIRTLQPRSGSRHAVFFTHPREAVTYHYERRLVPVLNGQIVDEVTAASNPNTQRLPDPRIQHALTLEVDEFGNVLKEATIGYGRRFDSPDAELAPEDREKQRLIHITCTENTFTNPIVNEADTYRTPLPAETRTYELRRPEQEKSSNGQTNRYRLDDLLGHINQAGDGNHDVNYEDVQFARAKQAAVNDVNEGTKYFRRLVEQVRTLYRRDDMDALLPIGELQDLALPGESYKLAFTPGLLDQAFVRNGQPLLGIPADVLSVDIPNNVAADRGGFVDLDGNGHWWIPTGRVFFSPDTNDMAAQELAFARQHFFLPHRFRDPFHTDAVRTESFVTYDAYDLLILETEDALGNRITVGERDVAATRPLVVHGQDYRVLQPRLVMDPNRNRTEVAFDALGLVAGTAMKGKPEDDPQQGDFLDASFMADLSDADVDAFYDAIDPYVPAENQLKTATTRIIYDMDRFYKTRQALPQEPEKWEPVFAATLARETHVSDLGTGEKTKIQLSFSYSDGFGREIQKKIQAEPETSGGPPRWVGSGWTIFNNKGKPVRQYEPFFSQLPEKRHQFEFGVEVGVSPILFYDPVERVVATLHPNHTYEKVVFDPWWEVTYDVNDTVTLVPSIDEDVRGFFINSDGEPRIPESEYLPTWYQLRTDSLHATEFATHYPHAAVRLNETAAAAKAAAHADTPTTAHLDTLGRPFLTIAHNRVVCPNHTLDGTEDRFHTRVELDIEGNQRAVRDAIQQNGDALGRIVMRYDYDLLGNRIHQASMEAGERWMLNDVAGNPIRTWDSRGHTFRNEYDELRRPVRAYVLGADSQDLTREILHTRTDYGEDHTDDQGLIDDVKLNLRTRVFRLYDSAGVMTNLGVNPGNNENEAYDFKGNPLRSSRQLVTDYKTHADWLGTPPLDTEIFRSSTTYDALNRPVTVTSPDGSIYRPTFNEANLLDKVAVNLRGAAVATTFVSNINYNEKGQRLLITYRSGAGPNHQGVTTTYDYDKFTFRLTNLKTTRPAGLNGVAAQIFTDPTVVQDLRYTYDPSCNITGIEDAALQTIHHDGQKVEPVGSYTYDALYRLIEARGREHIGQTAFDFNPPGDNYRDYPFAGLADFQAHPNDTHRLHTYTEFYEYDAVGNFKTIHHGGQPTRAYEYKEESLVEPGKKSNRLTKTTLGNDTHTETYSYTDNQGKDVHGCMTAINSMNMAWDFEDQLQRVDLGGGGKAYYVYDAGGQRVRKVIESQNGALQKERIYLGSFEIYREFNGNSARPKLERETLYVMDDQQRIALVETQTIENSSLINAPVPGALPVS
jgi:hypothetical protein